MAVWRFGDVGVIVSWCLAPLTMARVTDGILLLVTLWKHCIPKHRTQREAPFEMAEAGLGLVHGRRNLSVLWVTLRGLNAT